MHFAGHFSRAYNPVSMALTNGIKLGPYEIVAPLSAGGMGEVEPDCGRERSRGPHHARFSRDGVGSGSPQAKSRAQRGISC